MTHQPFQEEEKTKIQIWKDNTQRLVTHFSDITPKSLVLIYN